jgi:chaperone required for assembly of F1-ATPase
MSEPPDGDIYDRMKRRLAPRRMQRFFSEADYCEQDGGFAVLLDKRGIKTPAGAALIVPSRSLAQAIAAEWRAQGELVEPATMPLTRMASTAVDLVTPSTQTALKEIREYASTDLLLFRAEAPEELAGTQARLHRPILEAVGGILGVRFRVSRGLQPAEQPHGTLDSLHAWLRRYGPFTLAGLHTLTTLSASVLMAVSVREGMLSAEDAWTAAHVEEDWNIARWGEDDEAASRRRLRWREFAAAALFCASTEPDR